MRRAFDQQRDIRTGVLASSCYLLAAVGTVTGRQTAHERSVRLPGPFTAGAPASARSATCRVSGAADVSCPWPFCEQLLRMERAAAVVVDASEIEWHEHILGRA